MSRHRPLPGLITNICIWELRQVSLVMQYSCQLKTPLKYCFNAALKTLVEHCFRAAWYVSGWSKLFSELDLVMDLWYIIHDIYWYSSITLMTFVSELMFRVILCQGYILICIFFQLWFRLWSVLVSGNRHFWMHSVILSATLIMLIARRH